MILLDTCAFLWLISDYSKIPPDATEAIKKCKGLLLSPITALELAIKHRNGKLFLPTSDILSWYKDAIAYWHINEQTLDSEVLIKSTILPQIHKDPFDRIIIATAIKEKVPLLTSDKTIPRYPNIKVIW